MKLNTAKLSRRHVLGTALAVAGLAAARPLQDAFAGALVATPRQGMGPFYPEAKPLDQDNDLTNVQGKPAGHGVGCFMLSDGCSIVPANWSREHESRFGRPTALDVTTTRGIGAMLCSIRTFRATAMILPIPTAPITSAQSSRLPIRRPLIGRGHRIYIS